MEKRDELRAALAAIFCHVFWGFSFLASRKGLEQTHVFVLLSHRFLIAFLAMQLIPGITKSLMASRKQLGGMVLLGLAQPVLYFFGEQYGLLHATTGFSGVMIAMIPVVSTLAAAPILGERPSPGQLLCSLISVGGVVGLGLMNGSSGTLDWLGVAALLLAVCAASAYTLLGRSLSASTSPLQRTYVMMGVGAAVFTALALVQCRGNLAAYLEPLGRGSYLLSVLYLSLLCSVAGFFLSSYAIGRLPVARETVFSNLTTAVSVFAGVALLEEPFSWLSLLFVLLILAGIWGVQRTARS
ncbi:MAG: DMT family transporter [Oscillospiraceae bacterium]|nr:DMT family transporter [Oscillospiraceae bacterium]